MKTVLIICRNHLAKAPRFLMEINALAKDYTIIAAGLSSDNSNKYSFIQLNRDNLDSKKIDFHLRYPFIVKKIVSSFIKVYLNFLKFGLQEFSKVEFEKLKKQSIDLIIVHHFRDLALGVALAKFYKVKLIFNAHEYYPLEFDDDEDWMKTNHFKLVKLAKKCAYKIDLCFCVGDVIAKKYKDEFDINCLTINNSKPFKALSPQLVQNNKIKLVHHGAAIRSRKIELMISAMDFLDDNYSLDLILVGNENNSYLTELLQLIKKNKNIKLVDAVPTESIPDFLNKYDIGIYILPPTNFNNKFALPNKFFEFIQARLALAIAPSPEMEVILKKCNLGVVATDFSPKSLAEAIKNMTQNDIMNFKIQSDKFAKELSVEKNYELIRNAVKELIN